MTKKNGFSIVGFTPIKISLDTNIKDVNGFNSITLSKDFIVLIGGGLYYQHYLSILRTLVWSINLL